MPMIKKTVKKMIPPEGLDSGTFCVQLDGHSNFKFIEIEVEEWVEELVEYA